MANETILTAEGIRELEERLEYMKTVTRKEIAEQINILGDDGVPVDCRADQRGQGLWRPFRKCRV